MTEKIPPITYGTREDGSMWLSIGNPTSGPHVQADWEFGEKYAAMFAATPHLLQRMKELNLACSYDVLNPCWNNRPTDKPGLHWGSEPDNVIHACANCTIRAAIAKAEGRA